MPYGVAAGVALQCGGEEHLACHGHSRDRARPDAGRRRRSIAKIAPSSSGKRIDRLSAGGSGRHSPPLQLVPLFYRFVGRPPNPAFPLLIHTAMYALIGGVGGLAFGLGLCGPSGAAKGLLAGAMERFLEQ